MCVSADEVLTFSGQCAGFPHLRLQDEWRYVTTRGKPDLDLASVMCEQTGCGSVYSVEYIDYYPGPMWLVEPECVKNSSVLSSHCVDLQTNVTERALFLHCSGQ